MSGRAFRQACRVSVLYEPEFLRYDKGVVADRENGVTKSLAHVQNGDV